jgi:hypothetical protein
LLNEPTSARGDWRKDRECHNLTPAALGNKHAPVAELTKRFRLDQEMKWRKVPRFEPFREASSQRRVILGQVRRPLCHNQAFVASTIELRPKRAAPIHRRRPPIRIPDGLSPQKHPRPIRRRAEGGVEPVAGAEIADALPTRSRVGGKFGRNAGETRKIADRRAPYHTCSAMPDEADDPVSSTREPQLDSRVENLVRSRIPAVAENQLSRPLVVNVIWRHADGFRKRH